jgi:hypothetical protein
MAVHFVTAVACCAAVSARADLVVPANAIVILDGSTTDLQCTDVLVAGTLRLGTGSLVNARHVSIQAGGTIEVSSGTITAGGNWSNAGQFVAGTSAVRFRDVCSLTSASISGNSSFATASFVSAIGRTFRFAAGSTQTVGTSLEIAGTAAQPTQFRSSAAGQVANINLLPGGTQPIQHVGVTDVWATGQWLASSLTNEGGGGNANRWFGGAAVAQAIPALQGPLLAALSIALTLMAGAALRRRERSGSPHTHRLVSRTRRT